MNDKQTGRETPPGAGGREKRPRRLLRWLLWAAAAVLLLLLALRLLLPVIIPEVLDRAAAANGLSVTCGGVALSLLAGNVEIRDFIVAPRERGEAFADGEYLRVDLDVSALFGGEIAFDRVEIDGMELNVERRPDGELVFLQHFAGEEGGDEERDRPEDEDGATDFTPPFKIRALRLQHVVLNISDRSVSPPFQSGVHIDLRVSDVGHESEPGSMELTVTARPALELLQVSGRGTSTEESVQAAIEIVLQGFHPRELAAYFDSAGIQPAAETLAFRMSADVEAAGAASHSGAVDAAAAATVELLADGAEAAAIDRLAIDAAALGSEAAELTAVALAGIRCTAKQTEDGLLAFGFCFKGTEDRMAGGRPSDGGQTAEPRPERKPSRSGAEAEEPDAGGGGPAGLSALTLKQLAIENCRLQFRDETRVPPKDVTVEVPLLTAGYSKTLPEDFPAEGNAEKTAWVKGEIQAPGFVGSLRLTAGMEPAPSGGDFFLILGADRLSADEIVSYFNPPPESAASGEPAVELTVDEGNLACRVDGTLRLPDQGAGISGDFLLSDLRLDGGGETLALDRIRIANAGVHTSPLRLTADEIEIDGPQTIVRLEPDAVTVLGMRFRTAGPGPRPGDERDSDAGEEPDDEEDGGELPAIEVGRLAWTGWNLSLIDETISPPAELKLTDSSLIIENLVAGRSGRFAGRSRRFAGPSRRFAGRLPDEGAGPCTIDLRLHAPGAAERIQLDGSIRTRADGFEVDLRLEGEGLSSADADRYLVKQGIEIGLHDAAVRFALRGKAVIQGSDVKASAALVDFAVQEADRELAGVDAVRIDDISLGSGGIRIDSVAVDRPRFVAQRGPEGALSLASLRFLQQPAGEERSAEAEERPGPAADAPAGDAPGASGSGAEDRLVIGRFRLNEAAIAWTDQAVDPAVDTRVLFGVEADDFVIGDADAASPIRVAVSVPGAVEMLKLAGEVRVDPEAPRIRLDIDGEGLAAGPLEPYLPDGFEVVIRDGIFHAGLEAGIEPHPDGGIAAAFEMRDVLYAEGGGGASFLEIDRIGLAAARIHPEGGIIAVQEIVMAGFKADVTQSSAGETGLLGVKLAAAVGHPSEAAGASSDGAVAGSGGSPGEQTAAAAAEDLREQLRRRLMQASPLITVDTIDIEIISLTVRDLESGAPTATAHLRVFNEEPIEILGKTPEDLPPSTLVVTGAADPVVGSIDARLNIAPFAGEPTLDAEVAVLGIDGGALMEALPALAESIDGSQLKNGSVKAAFEAILHLKRQNPFEFSLVKGAGASILLTELEVANNGGEDILAGLETLNVEIDQFNPETGDLRIRTMEIVKPQGRIIRQPDGISINGFLLKTKPEDDTAKEAAAATAEPAVAEEAAAMQPPAGRGDRQPDLAIEKLFMSDIDFVYTDNSVSPPMTIPLVGLDAELGDFSSRALAGGGRPVRFSIALQAGMVEFAERKEKGGLLTSVTRTVTSLVTEEETEERLLFDAVTIDGRLVPPPETTGGITCLIDSLELAEFKGLAAEQGVKLSDGVLDATIALDFKEAGGLAVDAEFLLADLSLSEDAGGPIGSLLALGIRLDTVIFILRDRDGAIRIPLDFTVPEGGLSWSKTIEIALTTLRDLIAKAIAGSPLRVSGMVTDTISDVVPLNSVLDFLWPFGGADEPRMSTFTVAFDPADTYLYRSALGTLEDVAEVLQEDESWTISIYHELGSADVEQVRRLVTVSTERGRDLAKGLARRRAGILEARSKASAQAKTAYAAGLEAEAAVAAERLRRLNGELGFVEKALDGVFERLGAASESKTVRRTRGAAIELARARLNEVEKYLVGHDIPGIEERLRVKYPRFEVAGGAGCGQVVLVVTRRK